MPRPGRSDDFPYGAAVDGVDRVVAAAGLEAVGADPNDASSSTSSTTSTSKLNDFP